VKAATPHTKSKKSKFSAEGTPFYNSDRTVSNNIPNETSSDVITHRIRFNVYKPNNIKLIFSPTEIVKKPSNCFNGSCINIKDIIKKAPSKELVQQDSLPEVITIPESVLPSYCGYLYADYEGLKLKKYWYKLVGRTLFQYYDSNDLQHFKVFDISGCFVKKSIDEDISHYKLYTFSLLLFKSVFKFYALDNQERDNWIKFINHSLNHRSVEDHYIQGVWNLARKL
jgi:hypothetical protein